MIPKQKKIKLFKDYKYGINYRCAGNDAKLGAGQGMKIIGDRVYFLSTVGYRTYVRYLDKRGNLSGFLTPAGVADSFDVLGDRLVYCGFFGDKLAEIYEGEKQLSHMNNRVMQEYAVVTPEYQVFANTDGYEIDGWVMKPTDYIPGRKYPAILSVHGGPRSLHGELFFNEHQLWAARGYFVLFCNPRGSEGKGDDFAHIWGRYGTIDYQDLMEFTDEMLRRYPRHRYGPSWRCRWKLRRIHGQLDRWTYRPVQGGLHAAVRHKLSDKMFDRRQRLHLQFYPAWHRPVAEF